MKLKYIFLIGFMGLLGACAPEPEQVPQRHHHHTPVHVDIREYRTHDDVTDSWWYWYFLYSNVSNTSATSPSYYYRSSAPVISFSSVPFVRVTSQEALPKEAQEALEGKPDMEEVIEVAEAPTGVQQALEEEANTLDAQNDAMTNEGGSAPADTESSSGSSSDSGSSGGGDSGGGGGGDGGGGGSD